MPPKHVLTHKFYMNTANKLRTGNLKIVSCFLCNAQRFYPGGRTVYLCQIARFPKLHVHLACYDAAVNEMAAAFPDHPFVESLR